MPATHDAPLSGAALDAEIDRIEALLVAREARIAHGFADLGRRAHAAIPRSLGGGAATGLGLGLLSWLFRPSARSSSSTGGAAPGGGLARYFAMLWPFVPREFRARIDPRLLSLFTALGLPLIERLIARRRRQPRAEPYVDLHRYAGAWFEVARLPVSHEDDGAVDATTDYLPLDRRRLVVIQRSLSADGDPRRTVGIAEQVPGGHGAKLRVNFASGWKRKLGLAWSDHWILRVDRHYGTALVGTPDRHGLWLLSRTPEIDPETYRRMIDYARVEGYDTDRVRMTRQTAAEAMDFDAQVQAEAHARARMQARTARRERHPA